MSASSRLLNDTIYEPGSGNIDKSGSNFFRHYTEAETHMQWTPNLNQHIHFSDVRDLDIVRDHPIYTDPKMIGSDFGLQGHLDWRQQYLTATVETNYMRNQLYDDAVKFDGRYVQVLPRTLFQQFLSHFFRQDFRCFSILRWGLIQVTPDFVRWMMRK